MRCALTTPREGLAVSPIVWKLTTPLGYTDYQFQISNAAFIKLAEEANAKHMPVFRWFRIKAGRLLRDTGRSALTLNVQPCNSPFMVSLRDDMYSDLARYFSEQQWPIDSIAEVVSALNIKDNV
jgi:hypothetical protein